jgi:O-antigen/teichoic acid export membrane protein
VAAQVLGPEAVTQYAVPARMFYAVGLVAGLLFLPLWPAYGEALARGDIVWIRRTLIRSLQMTLLLVGLPSFFMVIAGKAIVHIWVGPQIHPSFHLLLGMGIWAVLGGLGGALAMFLNGANILKFQAACGVTMASTALVLKIWLARSWGISGVIWATVIAYSIFVAIPMGIYVPHLLAGMLNTRRASQ